MSRGKSINKIGELAFLSELETFDYSHNPTQYRPSFRGTLSTDWQNGTATYLSVPALKRSFGSGTTEQRYLLSGIGATGGEVELYHRHVLAINDSLILDEQRYGGQTLKKNLGVIQRSGAPTFAQKSVKAMLGRGPYN